MAELYLSFKKEEYENLFTEAYLKELVEKVAAAAGKNRDGLSISIYITDDEEMRDLNNKYRGIDSSTDVLSFVNEEEVALNDIKKEHMLGDIVISYPFLKNNAEELKVSVEEEAKRLVIHGTLHLLGYDHKTNDFEKEEMLILQEKIVRE